MKEHILLIRSLIAWLLLFLLFFFVNLLDAPLPVLILPFLLIAVGIHQAVTYLLQRLMPNLSVVRRNAITIPVTLLPVALLLLSSVEQLTGRDMLLIVVLLLVVGFYIRKNHLFNR